MKRIEIFLMCMMLVTLCTMVVFPVETVKASGNTLYIGGSGLGNYTTIQSAIDAASSGDTVFVYSGIYYENVNINKEGINLKGEDKNTTIIDANGVGDTIYIYNQDNNYISGFTIRNAGRNGVYIHCYADSLYAIYCSINNTISDCIIYDNVANGIYVHITGRFCHTKFINVTKCTIFNNAARGIYIHVDGLYCHIDSLNNTISDSKIFNNSIDGINLHAEFYHCTVQGFTIKNCSITDNLRYGLIFSVSGDCDHYQHLVYHNNFINNTHNAYDTFIIDKWYSDIIQEGNYWDDYTGLDNDDDGIGDTSYNIGGGGNQDLYPLMYPWSPNPPVIVYVDDDNTAGPWDGTIEQPYQHIQDGINASNLGDTVFVFSGTYLEIYQYGGADLGIFKSINIMGENKETTFIYGSNSFPNNCIAIESNEGVEFSGFTINNSFLEFYQCSSSIVHDIIVNRDAAYSSWCVYIHGNSNNNVFYDNIFNNAEQAVRIYRDGSTNNLFYHNNFFNNTYPPYDHSSGNYFYNATLREGNYYDDYTGTDVNGDGIGDIPYSISGGSNQDLYPFMEQNGWLLPLNQPPYTPSNSNPANNATGIDINADLSWTGGDPDPDDTVTYDVYFGSMPPLQKVASNISTPAYNPGTLVNSLTYFWNVVAWDNHGLSTNGPTWYFTTINANNPPNKPVKPSGMTSGRIGFTYSYSASTTDPDDDNVYYWFDWGDGTNNGWDGPHNSGDNVTLAHSWIRVGTYPIKVKAKDIYGKESVWSDPLVISMPKIYINNPTIQLLVQRFPFFEKILNQYYYN